MAFGATSAVTRAALIGIHTHHLLAESTPPVFAPSKRSNNDGSSKCHLHNRPRPAHVLRRRPDALLPVGCLHGTEERWHAPPTDTAASSRRILARPLHGAEVRSIEREVGGRERRGHLPGRVRSVRDAHQVRSQAPPHPDRQRGQIRAGGVQDDGQRGYGQDGGAGELRCVSRKCPGLGVPKDGGEEGRVQEGLRRRAQHGPTRPVGGLVRRGGLVLLHLHHGLPLGKVRQPGRRWRLSRGGVVAMMMHRIGRKYSVRTVTFGAVASGALRSRGSSFLAGRKGDFGLLLCKANARNKL